MNYFPKLRVILASFLTGVILALPSSGMAKRVYATGQQHAQDFSAIVPSCVSYLKTGKFEVDSLLLNGFAKNEQRKKRKKFTHRYGFYSVVGFVASIPNKKTGRLCTIFVMNNLSHKKAVAVWMIAKSAIKKQGFRETLAPPSNGYSRSYFTKNGIKVIFNARNVDGLLEIKLRLANEIE